jgi:ABC-type Fe3+ transport system substrate-binding protein
MNLSKWLVLAALVVVLGVPFVVRMVAGADVPPSDARQLVIITPHNEQIRTEFEAAFDRWHREQHGEPAAIIWIKPGGTSEIRRQLQSVYSKAIATGRLTPEGELAPGRDPLPNDLLFGGGSYEHGQIKRGVSATHPETGQRVSLPISVPMDFFSDDELTDLFGENRVGADELYDPEKYWLGTAVSGFGIVYNRDILAELGLPEPRSWNDLRNPRYTSWLALADPRQSGSVTTTYDSILNNHGWERGWRILRDMAANARYFSNSSSKVPIDVSQGEAAAGVAIDFYGRYQAQAVMQPGETPETSRVGYIDPPGEVFIDPDPISILRAGPDPELAERFVRFTLSEQGQALWQFHAREGDAENQTAADADADAGPLGPRRYELRRMPSRRVMYAQYGDRFVDAGIRPFEIASQTESRGWRSMIAPMMAAFSADIHAEHVRAWRALNRLRAAHESGSVDARTVQQAEDAFYAMPSFTFPDDYVPARPRDADEARFAGQTLPFTPENYGPIRNAWRDGRIAARAKIDFTNFFREQYGLVEELAREALTNAAPAWPASHAQPGPTETSIETPAQTRPTHG